MNARKNGFSLAELMVVVLINLIAISIAIQLSTEFNKDYKILIGYLNSYLKGREIIDRFSKDCRMTIRVMDDYAGYTSGNSTLVLKVPSTDASGNIIDVNNYFDYIIYRVENGDLWKTVIPGSSSYRNPYDDVLKKGIDSLYITFEGTPLSDVLHKSVVTNITFWVSLSQEVLGKEYNINPGTTVKLMNYEWEFVR